MASETNLAEVGSYNAVTIDPFQGACGLSLFKVRREEKDEIERYLEDCNRYCEVFQNIEDMRKAIRIDIMVYTGLIKLFPTKKERDKWKDDIKLVSETIAGVLDVLVNKKGFKEVKLEDIEKSIEILIRLREVAEEKLHRPEEEIFYDFAQ